MESDEADAANKSSASQPLDEALSFFKELTQDFIISKSTEPDQNSVPLVRKANPRLENGKRLPESWMRNYKPDTMSCKPLEDIDRAYGNEVIIN